MPYVDTGLVSLFFEEAGTVGIPVLLLHELGGSSASWREVIPLFAPDRRVIAGGKPGPITRRLHAAFRRYVERTHLR